MGELLNDSSRGFVLNSQVDALCWGLARLVARRDQYKSAGLLFGPPTMSRNGEGVPRYRSTRNLIGLVEQFAKMASVFSTTMAMGFLAALLKTALVEIAMPEFEYAILSILLSPLIELEACIPTVSRQMNPSKGKISRTEVLRCMLAQLRCKLIKIERDWTKSYCAVYQDGLIISRVIYAHIPKEYSSVNHCGDTWAGRMDDTSKSCIF